jgi:hypothetical protein
MAPTHLAPIDPDVPVPPAVKAAAARAEAIHAQAYNTPPAPEAAPAPVAVAAPAPAPVAAPVAAAAPEPALAPVTAPVTAPAPEAAPAPDVDWQARYSAMKGRFDQSQSMINELQGQVSQLGDEVVRHTQLAQTRAPQTRSLPVPLLTAEDEKTFGPELIDVVRRAAQSAVAPIVSEVEQRTQRLTQQVQQNTMATLYERLDGDMPDWRAINMNPRFKAWLALRDLYSGAVKRELLMDAFRRADAPRVLTFFKGFVSDEQATGQLPAPQPGAQPDPALFRAPAVPLETLSTPGRAHPASTTSATADKPVFTRDNIRWFYSNEGIGAYAGRPDARKADEQRIFDAQRDGRVR